MNNTTFYFFYNLSHQWHVFDQIIIFFAVYFPYIVVLSAVVFLFFHQDNEYPKFPLREFARRIREVVIVFSAGILAWVLGEVLKILFHASRPFIALANVHPLFAETGYSFPSLHATFFAALAISIYFSHKQMGYLYMFFALLIGLARIVAGVHFPIDILGGFILGSGIAYLVENV